MDNRDYTVNFKRYTRRTVKEMFVIAIVLFIIFCFFLRYDISERVNEFAREYEHLELDEFFSFSFLAMIGVLFFSVRRWFDIRRLDRDLINRNRELQSALDKVKTLEGILPICSNCKRIRTDADEWQQMESYVSTHSHAEFTHSLCPECARKLFPSLYEQGWNKKE